ncbi:hypothetical protein SLEP1_g40336 [Rubroshorea leprosula]|uniref:Uncharacterized protein n=1 Tax=Rubroshorea leprosula TaxID=152421 RepID=A0AAV5L340_9ROSI|nr:hypothetical protein SLEP1_g40336 [Rubroshorea leprosula]
MNLLCRWPAAGPDPFALLPQPPRLRPPVMKLRMPQNIFLTDLSLLPRPLDPCFPRASSASLLPNPPILLPATGSLPLKPPVIFFSFSPHELL